MSKKTDRKLSVLQLIVSLVSLHYGLGFLVGTSEEVFNKGLSGMTYPIMCALGLIFLAFLVPFYWRKKYSIWLLFEMRYGKKIKKMVIFLSWIWMVGIVASQVLGSAYILNLFEIPIFLGIIFSIAIMIFVSLLSIMKLAKLLLFLLILNSGVLIFGIFNLSSLTELNYVLLNFPSNLFSQNYMTLFGIGLPTILITIMGMDFHQFIVQGKTVKKTIIASLLAGLILVLMSLMPILIVYGAKNNGLLSGVDGKQIIPVVLMYVGDLFGSNTLGFLLILSLLTVSIGSGSCLIRIIIKTFREFNFFPIFFSKSRDRDLWFNFLIVFILSYTGKTIVSLIVCFYIVYITGILIPFLLYIFDKKSFFPDKIVYCSAIFGSGSSLVLLVLSKFNSLPVFIGENLEFFMLLTGFISSVLVIIYSYIKDGIMAAEHVKNKIIVVKNKEDF